MYVDDLLLAGRGESRKMFWQELGKLIEIEDIGGLGRFLGRHHEIVETPDGLGVAFNIREYIRSAVDMYLGSTKQQRLKGAATPFVPSLHTNGSRRDSYKRMRVQFS